MTLPDVHRLLTMPAPVLRGFGQRLTSIDMVTKKSPDATYVVDPPDAIKVEFLNESAMMTRSVVLRTDGCVTLPYLEDVKVAGLTPIQIREKLEKLYSRYYREPRILVTVTSYASKHIYLYGEVGNRGSLPYKGHMTVMDAMGQVGGFTSRAAAWRAKLIRRDPEKPETYRINLKKLLYEGDVTQDVSLAESDVIYVPPTVLAWIGYKLESILFPINTTQATRSSVGAITHGAPIPTPGE